MTRRTWKTWYSIDVLFGGRKEIPYRKKKKKKKKEQLLYFYLSGKFMLSSDTLSGPQTEIWKYFQLFNFRQLYQESKCVSALHQEDSSWYSDAGQTALRGVSEGWHQWQHQLLDGLLNVFIGSLLVCACVCFNTCGDLLFKTHKAWEFEIGEVKVTQFCLTLCNSMDCSPPGSSAHGILQARILEWVAISFSRGSSRPRDRTWVSCIIGRIFTLWAIREVHTCWWWWFHC